jgi:DNA-binding NtrC family response regulator
MEPGAISSLLVVDDDAALSATMAEALGPYAAQVDLCPDRRSALAFLAGQSPELLLLDLALPDGDAFDVLEILGDPHPMPRVVAMSGVASPEQSFRMAQLGVRVFLAKPFDTAELLRAVATALSNPPDLRPQVRSVVGQRSLAEVESEVRATMVSEALARRQGSRRAAARLLQVSRQLLQHIIKKRSSDG